MFFSLTNRNDFQVFVTLTWEGVIFIFVYVYPRKCLLRHILSTRSHIGVWNIFLKTLSRTMLILSPFTYVIYFYDIDDVYWMHDKFFMSVLDRHAPIKTKTVNAQVPYMNSALRKAINQRNMWRSKYFKNRNDKQLRMKYVMWRNRVVKLHKNSIRNYFTHRCHGNVGSKNFYKTIKPFLSTKQSCYCGSKIVLK